MKNLNTKLLHDPKLTIAWLIIIFFLIIMINIVPMLFIVLLSVFLPTWAIVTVVNSIIDPDRNHIK